MYSNVCPKEALFRGSYPAHTALFLGENDNFMEKIRLKNKPTK